MTSLRRIIAALAARLAKLPVSLRIVLVLAAVLHGVGLSWGMPASDGWDVDGIAPRDILPGLAQTYTPGEYYTYPPLHLALLAILTLPVTIAGVLHTGTMSVDAVIHELIKPSYMTVYAMTARVVSLLMSLGIVLAFAKIAEELAPEEDKKSAATWAAVLVALDAPFTYYAHATNLDVPYLFWASFSALALVRAVNREEPRRLRGALVFAALAIATKDQAYAMFLLAMPIVVLVMARQWRTVLREVLIGGAIAIGLLLLVDGAITNPSGFKARLGFLSGSASQDFATYSKDMAGRWAVVVDSVKMFTRHYPVVIAIPIAIGIVVSARSKKLAAIVPLALALSFTICFNMVARRVEERFTLLQNLVLAIYGGIGLARTWRSFSWLGRFAAVALALPAVYLAVRVDTTILQEPRYAAEEYVAATASPGDIVEVHGLNVYLARFEAPLKPMRVGRDRVDKRNPMYGMTEVQDDLANIEKRHARFVVVNGCYFWRYMDRDLSDQNGRVIPNAQLKSAQDPDATALFRGLFLRKFPYHVTYESKIRSDLFPKYELHASLGCDVWVFERDR